MSETPATPTAGVRVVAVILTACGLNALVQVPRFVPGWGNDPVLLSALQALGAASGLSAGIAAWRGRAWAWVPALLYGAITGAMIASLGPLLDLDAEARAALPKSGAAVFALGAAMAWYLRRAISPARLVVALLLSITPARGEAQTALLDSLRPRIEAAVSSGDHAALDPLIARLRAATRGPAARDPWTHYDLGYALHRRASAMLLGDQVKQAKPLLEEAEQALAKSQELGGGAIALGLRGAVTGQLAGTGGMIAGMRMGPRAFKQLDEALVGAPQDARVALLNGMTRLNAPRPFGGGPNKGEPELRRAVALFAQDAAKSPAPVWGKVDAHIWLAIALDQLDRRAEARAELQKALALAPGHAWVVKELLPALDARR